jgi:hypothetical protein
MALVKVVNVSGSIVHINNPNTVLAAGASMIVSEDDLLKNQELRGAIAAEILEKRSLDASPEHDTVEEAPEESPVEESDEVIFSDADLNAEPVSDSSFVRGANEVIEVNPSTAEKMETATPETREKEYIDGMEILEPVVDKTRTVNGVEFIIDDKSDDEYDSAFVDLNQ